MMKQIRIALSAIKEGLRGLWSHRSMALACILTIMSTLVILGYLLIAVLSIHRMTSDLGAKVDEIELFLYEDISQEERDSLKNYLESEEGVGSVVYRSSEDAFELMKKSWGTDAYIFEGLENSNVLPESYIVRMQDLSKTDELAKTAVKLPGVEKVSYYQEMVEKVMAISKYVRLGGIVVITVLLIISVFLISNTIKIAVNSRRKEINIKKYVGATNGIITAPFIVEGLIIGLLSSLLALAVVYLSYTQLYSELSGKIYSIVSGYIVDPQIIRFDFLIIFVTLGVGIGVLGSTVSLKKHLKV